MRKKRESFGLITLQDAIHEFSHNPLQYLLPTTIFLFYSLAIIISCIGLGYIMLMLFWGFNIDALIGAFGYGIIGLVVFALLFILSSAGKGAFLEMLYKEKTDIKTFLSLISKKGLRFALIFFIKDLLPSTLFIIGGIAYAYLPQPLSFLAIIFAFIGFVLIKIIFFYLHCPLIIKDKFGVKESLMALINRAGDALFLIVITTITYFLMLFPLINIVVILILLPIVWKARVKTFKMMLIP